MKIKPEDITKWLEVIMPHLPAFSKEVRLTVVALFSILAFTVVAIWKGPEVAICLSEMALSAKSLFR